MTMDEITKLVDDFGRVSAVEGDADLPHSEAWIESRAALLRAVKGIVGTLATETKERERCRDGWANERARAERAESALAAARALVESEQAWGLQYGDARCIWCGASPADPVEVHGDGCEFGALVRALSSAPPSPSVSRDAPWYLADGSTVMLPAEEVERRRKLAAKVLALVRRFVREDEEAPGDLRWGHHIAEDGTDLGMDPSTFALDVDRLLCEIERAPSPRSEAEGPPKLIERNTSTEEGRAFWASAEQAAAEVESWPDWKRAGINEAKSRARARSEAESGVEVPCPGWPECEYVQNPPGHKHYAPSAPVPAESATKGEEDGR